MSSIVLNLALVNHPSTDVARSVNAATAVPVAPVVLHRRVAHVNSFNVGGTRSRSATTSPTVRVKLESHAILEAY